MLQGIHGHFFNTRKEEYYILENQWPTVLPGRYLLNHDISTRHPEAEALLSTHNPGLSGLNPVALTLYTL